MEGYGRSTKDRDNNAPIAQGADDCYAAALYVQKLRGKRPSSSTEFRPARCARRCLPSGIPEMVARLALDAMVWTGEGSPTLEQRRKKLPEFLAKNRRPIDKAFIHSIFDRDHPGTAEQQGDRGLCRRGRRARHFRAHRHLCRHVLEAAGGRPGQDHGADADHARTMGRHRLGAGPHEILRQAAQPGQAVHGDAGDFARELPAEELHDGLSHPGELLRAAGSRCTGASSQAPSLPARSARSLPATSTGTVGPASPVFGPILVDARDVAGAQPALCRSFEIAAVRGHHHALTRARG